MGRLTPRKSYGRFHPKSCGLTTKKHQGSDAAAGAAASSAARPPERQPKKPTAPTRGKAAKRTKPAQAPNKPISIDELHRKMMVRGLITRLPDPSLDIDDDDPDDQPVTIKGEPLSETIIRERR